MMNYTNLNITNTDKTFKYIVEYQQGDDMQLIWKCSKDYVYLFTGNEAVISINKELKSAVWGDSPSARGVVRSKMFNDEIKTSKINVYFPRFSVDAYHPGVKYHIDINTWIGGKEVHLLSRLVSHLDCVSTGGEKRFLGDRYYDMIEFDIVDPVDLLYGDKWKKFRKELRGDDEKNNIGSNLNVTISPVIEIDGVLYPLDYYNPAQSALTFSDEGSHINCKLMSGKVQDQFGFSASIQFNSAFATLKEYVQKTYFLEDLDNAKLQFHFEIRDENNLYFMQQSEPISLTDNATCNFFPEFDDWDSYIDGLYADVLCSIGYGEEQDPILVLRSNRIDVTPEVYKFLITSDLKNIDLENDDLKDMKNYTIDAINHISVQKVIATDRVEGYKSNIQKPIFIKTQDTENIIIHRDVIENIAINLDAYKNKVDAFMLRIGDTSYPEIGRLRGSVIFKISKIAANVAAEGTYYITNSDQELITTGQYKIV